MKKKLYPNQAEIICDQKFYGYLQFFGIINEFGFYGKFLELINSFCLNDFVSQYDYMLFCEKIEKFYQEIFLEFNLVNLFYKKSRLNKRASVENNLNQVYEITDLQIGNNLKIKSTKKIEIEELTKKNIKEKLQEMQSSHHSFESQHDNTVDVQQLLKDCVKEKDLQFKKLEDEFNQERIEFCKKLNGIVFERQTEVQNLNDQKNEILNKFQSCLKEKHELCEK